MRHVAPNIAGSLLLVLAMAGSNAFCLNCSKPGIAEHWVQAGKVHVCSRHTAGEERECSGTHCEKYLSIESSLPTHNNGSKGCNVWCRVDTAANLESQPRVDRVLLEGQRLWRTPPPPFRCGLAPRLI